MNRRTQQALAAVNRRFYEDHAAAFDGTRSAPWKGWERLLAAVAEGWPRETSLRVLDAGCGNGRFGALVRERWAGTWSYLGLDSSAPLLAAAELRLAAVEERELRPWDLLQTPLATAVDGAFGLVAVFGVLHHVPGAGLRRRLLRDAASLLAPGGFLAFTVWRFGEDPRFHRRTLPWSSPEAPSLDLDQLEAGDVLLRWGDGEGAVRYCHGADDAEQAGWLADLREAGGLELRLRFDGDGRSGRLNRYFLLRKV
jgi:tRNA (uracil-5-)-methyltransferase TRM9